MNVGRSAFGIANQTPTEDALQTTTPPPLSALCLFLHLNRCVRAGLQVSRIGGMPLDFVWLLACFIAIERAWTALDLAPLKNMENNFPVTMVESNQPALGFNISLGRQTHTHKQKNRIERLQIH